MNKITILRILISNINTDNLFNGKDRTELKKYLDEFFKVICDDINKYKENGNRLVDLISQISVLNIINDDVYEELENLINIDVYKILWGCEYLNESEYNELYELISELDLSDIRNIVGKYVWFISKTILQCDELLDEDLTASQYKSIEKFREDINQKFKNIRLKDYNYKTILIEEKTKDTARDRLRKLFSLLDRELNIIDKLINQIKEIDLNVFDRLIQILDIDVEETYNNLAPEYIYGEEQLIPFEKIKDDMIQKRVKAIERKTKK